MKLHRLLKDYKDNRIISPVSNINCTVVGMHLWEKTFKNEITIRPNLPRGFELAWNLYEQDYRAKNPKKTLRILPLSTKLTLYLRMNTQNITVKCNLLQACIIWAVADKQQSLEELKDSLVV